MTDDDRTPRRALRPPGWALVRYVLAWAVGGLLVALVAVALLDRLTEDEVSLPPVRETALADAVRGARCEFRQPVPGEATRPPVDGMPARHPAPPGVHEKPLPAARLVAAIRRGVIVIHYRPNIDSALRARLETIQTALPEGTIVAPDASGMPYLVAVTTYRRLLGCRSVSERTFDAIRLFRGRFVGTGPDR